MPPAMRWSNHRLLGLHRTLLLPCHFRTYFGTKLDLFRGQRIGMFPEGALLFVVAPLARPDSTLADDSAVLFCRFAASDRSFDFATCFFSSLHGDLAGGGRTVPLIPIFIGKKKAEEDYEL